MHTKWIVGALAAALWIAPAGAQTGSTSGGMERPHANGNGSDPSRNTTDTNTQSGSTEKTDRSTSAHDSAATTGTGSHASTDRDMPSGGAPGPAGSGNMSAGSTSSGTGTSSADTTAPAGGSPGTAGSASTSSGHPTSATSTADATAGTAASETASTLAKLHDGNQAEVEAGTWMREHAQNSKVKDFAKKMVDDHSKMDKDVMSFAHKKNIDLASAPETAEKKDAEHHMESIKAMKGAQADRAYMDMMVQDHEKDVSEARQAEKTAKAGHDDELAKLLDKSAKKMEGHLKDAQKIQRDLTQRQARNPNQ